MTEDGNAGGQEAVGGRQWWEERDVRVVDPFTNGGKYEVVHLRRFVTGWEEVDRGG